MFKGLILNGDILIPNVQPLVIKSVEILEGDGGAGTIKLVTFGEGSHHKCVKKRVDAIDKENFIYSYTVIEGDALMDKFESISYHIKIVASPDGGSICKNRSIYNTKGNCQVSEEEIKAGKAKASEILKAIETYLLANPDYC